MYYHFGSKRQWGWGGWTMHQHALICCHWREFFLSEYEQRRTNPPSVPPSRIRALSPGYTWWRGGNCHEQRMSCRVMRPERGHNPHESLSWKAIIVAICPFFQNDELWKANSSKGSELVNPALGLVIQGDIPNPWWGLEELQVYKSHLWWHDLQICK